MLHRFRSSSAVLVAASLTAAMLVAPARAAAATPIYIFAGQSNMVGYLASTHELATVAPNLMQPSKNVQFFGPYDDYAVQWRPLQPPTEFRNAANHNGFGPELSAAASLSSLHHGANIAIVKYAVNGTNLHSNWNPALGALYHAMIGRARAAAKALRAPYRFAGFFWMQGESDADRYVHASAYRENLTEFIASVRRDLHTPNLPVVIGRIRDIRRVDRFHPFSSMIRRAQYDVAAADAHTFLVSSDGLQLANVAPRVHFSTKGTVDLGRRMVHRGFGL